MKTDDDHLKACRKLLRVQQQRIRALEKELLLYKPCTTCASGNLKGWSCPDCHRAL